MLTKEEIAYIRDWAESGNESRLLPDDRELTFELWKWDDKRGHIVLNETGLTIANQASEIERLKMAAGMNVLRHESDQCKSANEIERLKAALAQANEVAEDYAQLFDQEKGLSYVDTDDLETMRRNLKELTSE